MRIFHYFLAGIGFMQLQELLTVMDIKSMSHATFHKYQIELFDIYLEAAAKSMREAGQEELRLARERNAKFVGNLACIPVVTDGTWLKRSYHSVFNSNSGVAIIIGYYSQKVLYVGVRNKYCFTCDRAAKANLQTVPDHHCFKNWGGSSSSMETDVIIQGFKSSIEQHGLIYETLIADGDSSVFGSLDQLNIYEDQGIVIKKIECVNHLLRNMTKSLKKLAQGSSGPKHLRDILLLRYRRFRSGVSNAVEYRTKETGSFEDKVFRLREDIENVCHHVLGDHSKCASYFCHKTKTNNETDKEETNFLPEFEQSGLLSSIKDIMQRLAHNSESLLMNLKNNIAESFNNVVAKFVGGKRINFGLTCGYEIRSLAAVISFNSMSVFSEICATMNKNAPKPELAMEKNRKLHNDVIKITQQLKKMFGVYDKTSQKTDEDKNLDYGVNCKKPDMKPEHLDREVDIFKTQLSTWQVEREQIFLRTMGGNGIDEIIFKGKKLVSSRFFGQIAKKHAKSKVAPLINAILYTNYSYNQELITKQHYKKIILQDFSSMDWIESSQEIRESGLIIDRQVPYIFAMPDALIGNDGVLEIVCLSKHLNSKIKTLQELKNSDLNHLLDKETGKIKERSNLYFDIQGKLHITEKKFCIVIFWTKCDSMGIKVEKDDEFWSTKIESKVKTFYETHMIPEIVDSRVKRSMKVREIGEDKLSVNGEVGTAHNQLKFKNLRCEPGKKRKLSPRTLSTVSPKLKKYDIFENDSANDTSDTKNLKSILECQDSEVNIAIKDNCSRVDEVYGEADKNKKRKNTAADEFVDLKNECGHLQKETLANCGSHDKLLSLKFRCFAEIWPQICTIKLQLPNVSNINNLKYFMNISTQNNVHYNFAHTMLGQAKHMFSQDYYPYFPLFLSDFQTLKGNSYVSDRVIDYYMIYKKNNDPSWKNIDFFTTSLTLAILGDNCNIPRNKNHPCYNIEFKFEGLVLFPYCKDRHWQIALIDVNEKSISNYDPLTTSTTKRAEKEIIEYFKIYKKTNPHTSNNLIDIQWKIVDPEGNRPLQTDNYNCALYILQYMDGFAKRNMLSETFEPNLKRIEVADNILQSRPDMSIVCLKCRRSFNQNITFYCRNCRRPAHNKCAKALFKSKELCRYCETVNIVLSFTNNNQKIPKIRKYRFPNSAGQNNCWLNSSLQVIFALRMLEKIDGNVDLYPSFIRIMKQIESDFIIPDSTNNRSLEVLLK